MDSFPSREYFVIAFAYGVSVSALYLFGFWGVFHINVLEFIGLTDLAKLSVKPLLYSLPGFLLGFAVAQMFSGVFPPGGGADAPIGQFGRKYSVLLLILVVVLILAVMEFVPNYWIRYVLILMLVVFLSIASTHLNIVITYLPNPRIRQVVMVLLFMIPVVAFHHGEIEAHAIKGGYGDLNVDTLRSKLELTVTDTKPASYVGYLGDFMVLYETATDRVVFVKLKDTAPLVLQPNQIHKHTDDKSSQAKDIGKAVQPVSPSIPANVNNTPGAKSEMTPDTKEAKAPEEKKEWFGELFNVKLTDYVIAVFTIVIGVYTICLTQATRRLASISNQQEHSTRIIERAYVRLSHLDTGIRFTPPGLAEGNFRVKNFGHTPARISSVILTPKLTPDRSLPKIPDYSSVEERVMRAFLVRDDELFFYRRIPLGAINDDLEMGRQTLWFYGYVDYRDQFGQRYRAGYAGRFEPGSGPDNLIMEAQDGYNYDRQRHPGEGLDWDDPA
jgi:hypothetical protein